MLRRLHVARSRFAAAEDAVLAEAVMNAQTATDPMTLEERIVYDGDQYLGRIMMDGHFLTFYNDGLEQIFDNLDALEQLGASRERALLGRALALWAEHGHVSFDEASESVRDSFSPYDEEFFAAAEAEDALEVRIKRYVREHLSTFIILE